MGSNSANVASLMTHWAKTQPGRLAVVHARGAAPHTRLTYAQLDMASDRLAWGLSKIKISDGLRTVVMVKPGLDFFTLTFALFKVGAVPVLIDPGMGIRSLTGCLLQAQPQAFIGIPRAQIARLLFRWSRSTMKIIVTAGKRWFWGGYTLSGLMAQGKSEPFSPTNVQANDPAAILFTSGSTGPPKGAVYTHTIFVAQVEALKRLYGINPGEVDLATFPLFALFSPALGMTSVIPDMDFTRPGQVNVRRIVKTIADHGVNSMFGSPALLERLGDFANSHRLRLPKLTRIVSAGAPVRAEVLKAVNSCLNDGVSIFTPYGATEALPVCSISSQEILNETAALTRQGAGVCVGKPMAGLIVRIIKIGDAVISRWSDDWLAPSGEIGEIIVKGPVVTREYFHHSEATALAKIIDGDSYYHRMGDLGYFDETGRLWFCGRKAHRVVTPAGTCYTIPCEAIFNQHPRVRRSALVGLGSAPNATPVICLELKPAAKVTNRTQLFEELRELAQAHPHTRAITRFIVHPGFPVDIRHNAKIFREKLAGWVARRMK